MSRLIAVRFFAAVAASLLAAGCGGGGGGPAPVVIGSSSIADGTTGVPYAPFTFSASGGSGTFTWTETGALPPGLTLSAAGQLSGTPLTAGTYPFTVTATDASNPALTDSTTVSIKIADSMISVAPAAPPAGTVTYPYPGFGFSVASGGSPPFTWSATTSTLPPGLMLGSDGSLTGTPTSAGSFTFTVTATDSAQTPQTGNLPVTVTVTNPAAPVINPTPAPPAGTNSYAYPGFSFTATGGFLPLTWSLMTGPLPTGLTLGTDGSLSGIPTNIGPFPITVTVTDKMLQMNSAKFTVIVNNPPPPTISLNPPPTGTVGTPYNFQFTATGGLAPLVWSEMNNKQALPGLTLSLDGILSGTPSGYGIFPITVDVIDQLKQIATPMPFTVRISRVPPTAAVTPTGSLMVARSDHTATLLNGGKVLVTGGTDANGHGLATAELYDPGTGMFTMTTHVMTEARWVHTATVLGNAALKNNGKVLIVGSVDATAELYDPATDSFTPTGAMAAARTRPTATLLNTGKVLVAGGNSVGAGAELYDPSTETFADAGSMTIFRVGHTATLLLDGRVLIAGGGNFGGGASVTAEVYDPVSGKFSATGGMTVARTGHTATRLQDGTVLVVGSEGTSDLYDPAIGTFAAVGSLLSAYGNAAYAHSASLRGDGTILVAGGFHYGFAYVRNPPSQICKTMQVGISSSTAALFAPESDGFTLTAHLGTSRDGHTATVLADGAVLIVGGRQQSVGPSSACRGRPLWTDTVLSSAELYQ